MQSQHFGGSTSVSIEGYSVHHKPVMDYDLAMDFHSFLSDSKVQHASTVYNHMDKLLAKLKKLGVLKDGGRVLCMTGGCAAQYRSATSLFWMVINARKYNIVLDREVSVVQVMGNLLWMPSMVLTRTLLAGTAGEVYNLLMMLSIRSQHH